MKLRLICALLLVPAAVFAAAALPIEFNGVLIQGGKTTVSLLNPNTGTARWVALGGKFDTYIVTSYLPDPKGADVVVLTKAGTSQTVRVVLKNSLIVAATTAPVTDEQLKAVLNNLLNLRSAAQQYYYENGLDSVTFDQLVGTSTESYVQPFPIVAILATIITPVEIPTALTECHSTQQQCKHGLLQGY